MRFTWLARPVVLGCGLFCIGIDTLPGGESAIDPQKPAATAERTSEGHASESAGKIILAGASESPQRARDRIKAIAEGTSSEEALTRAKSRLPLDRLSSANRRRVEAVLEEMSMFRAMPTIRVPVDRDVHQFFVEHPDVAVSTWRALDVSKCQLWQTGPNSYETEIGDGSFGVIDVLLRGSNDCVVIGEGQFKSPLMIRPVEAIGVMHLQTRFVKLPDGETAAICHANLFVTFPSQTIETAAKVISPLTNMVIDRNFEEVGLYAHVMTEAMRNNPGWVERLAGRLDGILESSRRELLEVTAKAYVHHHRDDSLTIGDDPRKSRFLSPP